MAAIAQTQLKKIETLDDLSSAARAAGMTDQELAMFHWNTSDLEEVKKHLPANVYIPKKWQEAGRATKKRHVIRVKKLPFLKLKWRPESGSCGDKVKLIGETNLPVDTEVKITLKAKQGSSPKLTGFNTKVASGKIEHEWEIHNVAFDQGASFLESVEVEATASIPDVFTDAAILKVDALLNADEQTFTATRAWSGFTMNPKFKQKLDKFKNFISVTFDVIKAWGGYYVDLSSAGITGTAGGCPWAGHRWARATTNPMEPSEYHDGTTWKPLPAGFTLTGTNHAAIAFYKSGTNFVSTSGGTWPEAFADYDFNSATYTAKRQTWMDDTHTRWTDKFHLRRKNCKSELKTRCCRYNVDVKMTFNVVAAHAAGVVALCPGNLRSNASNWFMDDPDIATAAHESGHHMDNPDEYAGGAVDPSLNGDGAVNGIDADNIMGQNMTNVKKRHYHAFGSGTASDGMLKKLIKTKYGKDYDYETVDK